MNRAPSNIYISGTIPRGVVGGGGNPRMIGIGLPGATSGIHSMMNPAAQPQPYPFPNSGAMAPWINPYMTSTAYYPTTYAPYNYQVATTAAPNVLYAQQTAAVYQQSQIYGGQVPPPSVSLPDGSAIQIVSQPNAFVASSATSITNSNTTTTITTTKPSTLPVGVIVKPPSLAPHMIQKKQMENSSPASVVQTKESSSNLKNKDLVDETRFKKNLLNRNERKDGWHLMLFEEDRQKVENIIKEAVEFEVHFAQFERDYQSMMEESNKKFPPDPDLIATMGTWKIFKDNLLQRKSSMLELQEQTMDKLYKKICQEFPLFAVRGVMPEQPSVSKTSTESSTTSTTTTVTTTTTITSTTTESSKAITEKSSATVTPKPVVTTVAKTTTISTTSNSSQQSKSKPQQINSVPTTSISSSNVTNVTTTSSKPEQSKIISKQGSALGNKPLSNQTSSSTKKDNVGSNVPQKPLMTPTMATTSTSQSSSSSSKDKNKSNNNNTLSQQDNKKQPQLAFIKAESLPKGCIFTITDPKTIKCSNDLAFLRNQMSFIDEQLVLYKRNAPKVPDNNDFEEEMEIAAEETAQERPPPRQQIIPPGGKSIEIHLTRGERKVKDNTSSISSSKILKDPKDIEEEKNKIRTNNFQVPIIDDRYPRKKSFLRDNHKEHSSSPSNIRYNPSQSSNCSYEPLSLPNSQYGQPNVGLMDPLSANTAIRVDYGYDGHHRRLPAASGLANTPPPNPYYSSANEPLIGNNPFKQSINNINDQETNESEEYENDNTFFIRPRRYTEKPLYIKYLLNFPSRTYRPRKIVIILRGLPGSGKTHLARLIKKREQQCRPNSRHMIKILSLDRFFLKPRSSGDPEDPLEVNDLLPMKRPRFSSANKHRYCEEYDPSKVTHYNECLFRMFQKLLRENSNAGHNLDFVIVDSINANIEDVRKYYCFSIENKFVPYVIEMEAIIRLILSNQSSSRDNNQKESSIIDINGEEIIAHCYKHNNHAWSLSEIRDYYDKWELLPEDYLRLDAYSLMETTSTEISSKGTGTEHFHEDDLEPNELEEYFREANKDNNNNKSNNNVQSSSSQQRNHHQRIVIPPQQQHLPQSSHYSQQQSSDYYHYQKPEAVTSAAPSSRIFTGLSTDLPLLYDQQQQQNHIHHHLRQQQQPYSHLRHR